ncbi:MAG: hypothetical protein AABY55_04920, partial [Candidatus Omnitrophota bacterium]
MRWVFENNDNLEMPLYLSTISTVFTKKEKEPKRKKNDYCCYGIISGFYYGIYSTLEVMIVASLRLRARMETGRSLLAIIKMEPKIIIVAHLMT